MKTSVVAILSQKGGAGKTTIAIHLAVAAENAGISTVIIDLDPQTSASAWKDIRGEDAPHVVSAQAAARLTQMIETARSAKAGLVILDTAPHSESTALAAARASDLVLIPCRPAIFDLHAIKNTIDIAQISKKPAALVFNAVPVQGTAQQEAIAALAEVKIDISPHHLCQRAAYQHAVAAGQSAQEYQPNGKAAEEIAQLYLWMQNQLTK